MSVDMLAIVDFSHTPMMLLAQSFKVVCCHIIDNDQEDHNVELGRLFVVTSLTMTKRLRMLNLVIFIEADCCSKDTAFLKRFQELCERKDLSRDILLQDCCSKSTAFLTRFNFLVAYYYKIVVQKALLS